MSEWRRKVELLEQGISPDDLPINPHRKTIRYFFDENKELLGRMPEQGVEGYYSYYYQKKVGKGPFAHFVRTKAWYSIRKRPSSTG